MELWENRRSEHDQSERRMPWGAPQDSRDDSQPRSTPHSREVSAGGQTGGIWRRDPRSISIADLPRSCALTSPERGEVET